VLLLDPLRTDVVDENPPTSLSHARFIMASVLVLFMTVAGLALGKTPADDCDSDQNDMLSMVQTNANMNIGKPLKNYAVQYDSRHAYAPTDRRTNSSVGYKLNERTSNMVDFVNRISDDVVKVDERLRAAEANLGAVVNPKRMGQTDLRVGFTYILAESAADPDVTHVVGAAKTTWKTFMSHIIATTILVLLMCGDDLCWLLPFLGGDDKHSFAAFYVFCMCFMWALAWSLYLVAKSAEITHPEIPVEEITDFASTLLLMALTAKFFSEWYYEDDEEDDAGNSTDCEEQIKQDSNENGQVATAKEVCNEMTEDEKQEAMRKRRLTYSKLFLVSLGGNFDNIGVYIPIMLSGVFSPFELLIGDFIAAVIIALITLGLSGFKVLTDFFTQVPLWVIVGILTMCVAVNCSVTLAESNQL